MSFIGGKQINNSWLALYYTPPNFLIFLSSESIFVLFPPFKWSQRGLLSFSWNAHEHLPYFTVKSSYCGESLSTVCLFSSAQDSGRLIRARFSGCWCAPCTDLCSAVCESALERSEEEQEGTVGQCHYQCWSIDRSRDYTAAEWALPVLQCCVCLMHV